MKEEAAIYFQQTALIGERSLHERTARIPVHEKENDFQYKIYVIHEAMRLVIYMIVGKRIQD